MLPSQLRSIISSLPLNKHRNVRMDLAAKRLSSYLKWMSQNECLLRVRPVSEKLSEAEFGWGNA